MTVPVCSCACALCVAITLPPAQRAVSRERGYARPSRRHQHRLQQARLPLPLPLSPSLDRLSHRRQTSGKPQAVSRQQAPGVLCECNCGVRVAPERGNWAAGCEATQGSRGGGRVRPWAAPAATVVAAATAALDCGGGAGHMLRCGCSFFGGKGEIEWVG
ncbi:uncharacterized protein K452DRAFT_304476 [Aplosporella prunicola CBS 121167]|uniref:Uncharacterized protein n=1 Tax=Aplosporella prunicola CBS 121167 TaxID=1176127 RepID=A0A6A6BTC6_9PEZI|nr:uncharacterized protein K452DRAFT_304476 [Aplosporella prunicola CBS 121167]KAF2146515.1 hypothetical protein K452DRAFT_304476 [Aplosporella prunicola CBS 121167]